MTTASIKSEAHRLVDELGDDASWEDLIYAIWVRERIERGLRESAEGRLVPHADIAREFGVGSGTNLD
jgi:predicted transcriptional regulator